MTQGAGTFSEEGGQERDWRRQRRFFFTLPSPPTFEFADPEFSVLGEQTRIVAHPNY